MRIILLWLSHGWSIYAGAQVRLGIQGGYSRVTWASINATPSTFAESFTTSGQGGFQAGVVADVKLSTKIFLRPALFISSKGTRLNRYSWVGNNSQNIWIQYAEVPVTLAYQVGLGRKVTGFAGGGLYAAHAFSGVEKGQSRTLTGEYLIWDKVEFGSHNDGPAFQMLPTIVEKFDYGFTFLAGVEVKGLQLLLTYSHGLRPLLPNGKPYNGNYTNSGLTISAAYLIKMKR